MCCQSLDDGFYHKSCARKIFSAVVMPDINFDYDNLTQIARKYVAERLTIPGVQKKLSVKLSAVETNQGQKRLTIIGFLQGTHILKPNCEEYAFMPEVEHFNMRSAQLCGIETAIHALLPVKNNNIAYLCKRFDRHGAKKIAVEDACQLSGKLSKEKYNGSYEALAKIIRKYSSNPGDDCLKLFDIVLHAFITGNADMHWKNFSLMTDDKNYIHLSPAYDLLSTYLLISNDKEELALSLNGKKRNLRYKDWLVFAKNLQIPERVVIRRIEYFVKKQAAIEKCCQESFMPESYQEIFLTMMNERIERLNYFTTDTRW